MQDAQPPRRRGARGPESGAGQMEESEADVDFKINVNVDVDAEIKAGNMESDLGIDASMAENQAENQAELGRRKVGSGAHDGNK